LILTRNLALYLKKEIPRDSLYSFAHGDVIMSEKLDAKQLEIEEKNVTIASRFQEDLGADSLDIVELLMEIENEFGVNISDDESEKLKTVGDAVQFISAKL
jgi:acyl carrier protein